ncbi:MAG TPA: hypothetical protein VEZ55_02200 [Chitinophagaceae bacterium]|nr:hypothetical protein [Chitinophagaceae bacterium]
MKQVLLRFPDAVRMADFILTNKVSKVETDSREITIKGLLTDQLIAIAETQYEAKLIDLRAVE